MNRVANCIHATRCNDGVRCFHPSLERRYEWFDPRFLLASRRPHCIGFSIVGERECELRVRYERPRVVVNFECK